MLFQQHIQELKERCFYFFMGTFFLFLIASFFSKEILYIFTRPFIEVHSQIGEDLKERTFILTNLTEAFTVSFYLSSYFTFLFSFPLCLGHFWSFIEPGLYLKEKRYLRFYFISIPFLFLLGTFFTYFIVLPFTWEYLLGFETRGVEHIVQVHLEARLSEYVDTSIHLFGGISVLFQYPLVLRGLIDLNLLHNQNMVSFRKCSFFFSFFLGSLLSPPDLFSQFLIAFPLLLFYEMALFFLIWRRGYS